ncbi:hypothetical protein CcaCcLH18_01126 [Colletotrichum camelliae]|nr:hypothetical protein CcaCcLH18_01126 [Colletotrichum camelliae]
MSFVASYASIIPIPPSSPRQSRSSLAFDTNNGENAKTHHRLPDWLKQKARRLKHARHQQAPQESTSTAEPEKIEAILPPTYPAPEKIHMANNGGRQHTSKQSIKPWFKGPEQEDD